MDNSEENKLTKEIMADSRLNLANPDFDDLVLHQVLLESKKLKKRKDLLMNLLIFTGIELFIFALLLVLLLWFPGLEYFTTGVKNSLPVFQKIGKLAIEYDYLIFAFIVVGLLDKIMNRKVRASLNY